LLVWSKFDQIEICNSLNIYFNEILLFLVIAYKIVFLLFPVGMKELVLEKSIAQPIPILINKICLKHNVYLCDGYIQE
jgi:hypothetical protein